jgi:hypothetical protein
MSWDVTKRFKVLVGGIICLNFALIALLTYIGANILAPHTVAFIVNHVGMM